MGRSEWGRPRRRPLGPGRLVYRRPGEEDRLVTAPADQWVDGSRVRS